jgi:two-component system cell cycle response regulator CtrA
MRVLLVEDDLTAARGISLMLRTSGAVVDHTDTGEEALELTRHYEYDIVLLDIMLPDIEGYEVVRRMRLARNDTPVLILSGLARPQAKVKGLGMGADDYITKPFDRAELLARMQAIVRRCKGFSQPALRVGPLQLNLDSREVTVDGREVHLTGKEYAILELLVLRKGMVLTKEAFLNHLYGGMDEPEMKIIDVFICKLRKKLMQAGADNLIGTVWGRGYMVREPSSETDPMPGHATASREAASDAIAPSPAMAETERDAGSLGADSLGTDSRGTGSRNAGSRDGGSLGASSRDAVSRDAESHAEAAMALERSAA